MINFKLNYFERHIEYDYISDYDDLTEQDLLNIESNPDNQNWLYISSYKNLSMDFIQKYYDRLSIPCIIDNNLISPEIKELCKN